MYIGKALLERNGNRRGIPDRIMEHLRAILRKNSQCSRSVRAILFRPGPLQDPGFVLAERGPHDLVRASETVAIRMLKPNANECHPRRAMSAKAQKQRSRPPPRFPKQTADESIWETPASAPQIFASMATESRSPKRALSGRVSLNEAYRRKHREHFARTGKHGPLNIYSRRNGSLLTPWACTKGSTLHLRLLLRKHPAAIPVLRLARLVDMVPGYVKRRRGRQHVDSLLARLQLPRRSHTVLRSPYSAVLAAAQCAARHVAKALAARHGSCMYK